MEGLRKTLDNLMGKDRNLPIREQIIKRKHFDDPDVCKFFLIGFCPHELFQYVKSSNIGECHYRHDQQFKISFESDPDREYYQTKYEETLISFLESITSEVDLKMKRCLERIEMPLPDQVLNKDAQIEIENLDKEITEKINEAEHLGENGLIDQSEKLMKEIEQLKIQRNLLTNTKEHSAIYKDRQMKVCEICGALQSAIDNEKRIQTHKEGKIHSAYLKIRQYLDLLRKKRMERKIKEAEMKQKEKLMKELKIKEKEKEKWKEREKNIEKEYKEYKEYGRRKYSRSRSRNKSRSERERERSRKKYEEKYYDRSGIGYRREYKDYKDDNKDYREYKDDEKYHYKDRRKDRDRERDRDYYKEYKDRDRDIDRDKRESYKNIYNSRYDREYSKERREGDYYKERDKKERREYEKYYDRDRLRERDIYRSPKIKREELYNEYENKRRF